MSRVLRMLDTMRTEKEILEAIINGTVRIRRFNAQEQSGSSRDADRLLWLGILRAESELAAFECGKVCSGAPATLGGTTPPYRFLKSIAQPLPPSFGELAELLGHYEDRGQESIVCNSGDGNADYYISDLQPGRNTVIDANTGNVRFIDPRITLNDPAGPITPVSKMGKRKEELRGQLIT